MLSLWEADLPITSTQRIVLECLAYYTNDNKNKTCYPSYSTIAKKCCLGQTAVIRAIKQLEFSGLIRIEKITAKNAGFASNHYCINEELLTKNTPPPSIVEIEPLLSEGIPPSIGGDTNLINDLIINLKENNKKKERSNSDLTPLSPSPFVLRQDAKLILEFLRQKTGRNYQFVDTTVRPILQRLKEGITVQQCKQVIARKHMEWSKNPEMEKYLRPSTLFNKSNFYDKYLPEVVTEEDKKNIMKKC